MKEFKINFVGNDEEIKKEDILNDFDFNYLPINNLPVSYFPLNNGLLSNELKKINNEDLISGVALGGLPEFKDNILTINALNSPYTILVKKNIDCKLNLEKIRLNKGIYTIRFDINGYNIIEKNKKEIYKKIKGGLTSIVLDFINDSNSSNVKKISATTKKNIEVSGSVSKETATDNSNYKLLIYNYSGTLTLNKDIACDILIVGGGGGGGKNNGMEGGGGGGGGGVGMGTITLEKGTYNITIGSGGNPETNGTDTTIKKSDELILIAYGGGKGGFRSGGDGGSGGGGSGNTGDFKGGKATKGLSKVINSSIIYYGNNGGYGYNQSGGGGGGGAGTIGNSAINKNLNGGKGGNGIESIIIKRGTDNFYGGGGGGASGGSINNSNSGSGITGGTGGRGGGGIGGSRGNAGNGVDNKGGGGGGSSVEPAGSGGSGIVIIKIKNEDIEADIDNSNEILTSTDTRIINEINNLLEKKMIEFNNDEKPYNYLGIYPLVILIIIFWIFIFLFLLKFVHHYFVSIYLYILIFIIIFLLIFGSLWFLYTNNDLL
jgi:hypothetical protein